MRILQLMNRVPWPLKDGGALGFFNYTKGYHAAGCEVTVCALNTNKHHVVMNDLPDHVKQLANWRATDINTNVTPIGAIRNIFTGGSYNIERFWSEEFRQLLIQTLKEKAFDVVIFEGLFVAPYLDTVRTYSKAICVLREHNVEHQIWETLARNCKQPARKLYLSFLASRMKKAEMKALNAFDGLTMVTAEDARQFKDSGCTKPLFVSPFGIDMERLHPDRSKEDPHSVFHLGSMEWLPNQQAMSWFMEEVWPKVINRVPKAKFYLAGRGMPPSFKQYESASVHIIGEVEDAVSFMQQKQIMIVPLFAGSGIRVKILEGMALGKAIISTPLGAQGIDFENGKELIIAKDTSEFCEALVALLEDQTKVEQMGKDALILAKEQYDNTKVIDRVLSFYNELSVKK